MSLIKNINKLGETLPETDIPYFRKFIKDRDFEKALELVNSILILSEKAEDYNHNNQYLYLDKESLLLLQSYLIKYLDQLYF